MDVSKEVLAEIKMYQANDYEIKDETPAYILMTRNKATFMGHLLVFLVFGWWTFFLANLGYHFFSKEKKKVMK